MPLQWKIITLCVGAKVKKINFSLKGFHMLKVVYWLIKYDGDVVAEYVKKGVTVGKYAENTEAHSH
jgi:hypothetical protein